MEEIDKYLKILDETSDSHISTAKTMMLACEGNISCPDLLFLAAINRSYSQLDAFVTLVKARNYLAVAPMLRMQVDTILRIAALSIVDDINKVAAEIYSGKPLKKIEDKSGKKMADFYLLNQFKDRYPWIEGVYKECSGFIHLSDKHVHGILRGGVNDDGFMEMAISHVHDFVPERNWMEAIVAFHKSVTTILELSNSWTSSKKEAYKKRSEA